MGKIWGNCMINRFPGKERNMKERKRRRELLLRNVKRKKMQRAAKVQQAENKNALLLQV
jgi:hypothetical protein